MHSNSNMMPWQSERQGTELHSSDLKELMHTSKCFCLENKNKQKDWWICPENLPEEYSIVNLRKKLQLQQDN